MELNELKEKYGISDKDFKILLGIYAKSVIREAYSKAGKKGGEKNKEKGREYFQKISKLGLEARWKKHKERADKGKGKDSELKRL